MNFSKNHMKTFKINGVKYAVHDFIIKEADIFKALEDTKSKNRNFIIPDATGHDINQIINFFHVFR